MKDLGAAKTFLCIEVTKSSNGISNINQQHYIKKIVEDFGLGDAKISKIPLDSGYEKLQSTFTDILPNNEKYIWYTKNLSVHYCSYHSIREQILRQVWVYWHRKLVIQANMIGTS